MRLKICPISMKMMQIWFKYTNLNQTKPGIVYYYIKNDSYKLCLVEISRFEPKICHMQYSKVREMFSNFLEKGPIWEIGNESLRWVLSIFYFFGKYNLSNLCRIVLEATVGVTLRFRGVLGKSSTQFLHRVPYGSTESQKRQKGSGGYVSNKVLSII